MEQLKEELKSLPIGTIKEKSKVGSLIAQCWEEFTGSDDGGMTADKLSGRTEKLYWDPPILSFIIERHGVFVEGGSTRAEKQKWELNLIECTANFSIAGYTQIKTRQPNLNLKPIIDEIAKLIFNETRNERLEWSEDGSVYVQIGKIIPENSSFKQTVVSRRKRLRKQLDELLKKKGWQKLGNNHYKKARS